jgi:hypothetical protein
MRALGDLGVIAGDGAGNDDVMIHEVSPVGLSGGQAVILSR